jgi:hypothetical protein
VIAKKNCTHKTGKTEQCHQKKQLKKSHPFDW